jgi:hypothetical protein
VIVDEVWADPTVNDRPPHATPCSNDCWGDYSFCAQLIRWNHGNPDGNHTIRLAYYRRRCGEDFWEYASQMTVNADWETIKLLVEKTLARTTWFQDEPAITAAGSSQS